MNSLINIDQPEKVLRGQFGIEREGLRTDEDGKLAMTPHPKVFGEKLCNPYITTDFSESQIEMITPVFNSSKEAYTFLENLYDITVTSIGDEYMWPQSMPCLIPNQEQIPIANFCDCEEGQKAYEYRKKLFDKYGGKKQLVSGIHYNFSFDEQLIKTLYKEKQSEQTYREFKDALYLKVARNYLRYRWLLIYLLGSTSVIHESYEENCIKKLESIDGEGYTNKGAISYRNSECGYGNKEELFPDYTSISSYVESIKGFIQKGLIESPKELYSQIRPKAVDNKEVLEALGHHGIAYLEYRSIDVNPFDKTGLKFEDMEFLELFNLFLLFKEESEYGQWQEEALQNQRAIARFGQQSLELIKDGQPIDKEAWGLEILEQMQQINQKYNFGKQGVIDRAIEKLKDPKKTYAYQLLQLVKEKGYVKAHIDLAKQYKEDAAFKSYKLKGYEDLELSTQILMKEAIRRGIKVKLMDRSENFISLDKCGNVQYVKQATKTSKDNYVTVLMMENKTVTKEVLDQAGIRVSGGMSFDSIDEAIWHIPQFSHQPIVVKPKSTNFGIGISIFPEGAEAADLEKAVRIAFEHDQTILIEEFIKGKEYRFLVIEDQVVGILHRVPANVKGDGVHSIEELIAIKNQDDLRGKGYKTPLEKIQIDESLKLFIKQKGLTIESIPAKDEVIYLRENSNISTGGDSIDYTDAIPDKFKQIAIESAKAVGANICGVDMMIEDYEDIDTSYGIIELNFNPAIHIHTYPYQGKNRKPADAILGLLGY